MQNVCVEEAHCRFVTLSGCERQLGARVGARGTQGLAALVGLSCLSERAPLPLPDVVRLRCVVREMRDRVRRRGRSLRRLRRRSLDRSPQWSDDPGALHEINRRHRRLPFGERFRRRRHFDILQSWSLTGSLHPADRSIWISWNSIGGLICRAIWTAWYLVVGVPENRVATRRRLATGPWLHPPP